MIRRFAAAFALAASSPILAAPVTEQVRAETDGSSTLTHEVTIAAAPKDVWMAISTVEGWKRWAVPVAWASATEADTIETSYDQGAKPGDAGNIKNQFVARIPGRLLVFRTIKAPAGFPHFEAFKRVNQLFELAPAGKATRVTLTGVGYANNEAGKALLGFFRVGNRMSLEMLRDRFEKGPVDWAAKLRGSTKK